MPEPAAPTDPTDSASHPAPRTAPSPDASHGAVVDLIFSGLAFQVAGSVVRLGVADVLGTETRTAGEVARRCETESAATLRLLRAMAGLDLAIEARTGEFALSEAGAILRADHPQSKRDLVLMFTAPAMCEPWRHLTDSVRTGQPAYEKVFGTDFFDYLGTDEELSELFNVSMRQSTRAVADLLPAAYDFSGATTVLDVGGGDGTLLAAVLHARPHLRGILFDAPSGLGQAPEVLRRHEVTERCDLHAGDFFAELPHGADIHVMKSVLHDWDDDRATTILRNSRAAMPEHGRLVIVEGVLPDTVDGSAPAAAYLSDLNMLTNLGGRERTRAEFDALCRRAGFTETTVLPLAPGFPIRALEATPA